MSYKQYDDPSHHPQATWIHILSPRQKVTHVQVPDSIPARERILIQTEHNLRVTVPDALELAVFRFDRHFGCKKIRDLKVEPLRYFLGNEGDLEITLSDVPALCWT